MHARARCGAALLTPPTRSQVKFHRDIEPVALQYQRYKGIKGELERRKSK